jgi:glycosyltransferase involved in cell wall biosynthesis
MPSLSPTMNEGEIVSWEKNEGDEIEVGDVLCEIQTDKSVVAYEATEEGFLGKILNKNEKKSIKIGETIAFIVDSKNELNSIKDWNSYLTKKDNESSNISQSNENHQSTITNNSSKSSSSSNSVNVNTSSNKNGNNNNNNDRNNYQLPLAPSVQRILNENEWINPWHVPSSGKNGRITKSDLIYYMKDLSNKKIIGTIAELHHIKGINYLVKSAKSITESNTDTVFVVFGEGEERQNLEKQIIENDLQEKFFLLGFVDNASKYLESIDLFVLPSLSEGLALVLLEAKQANIKIVASRVGGIPEAVEGYENAKLFEAKNVDDLTKTIDGLINEPIVKNIAEDNFNKMLEKTIEVYN